MFIFYPSKLRRSKYVESTSIFCSLKLRRTKYIETTSIFCPLKLCLKSCFETTSIFHIMKLHQKCMSKWLGNLSIFSFWRIDVISISIRWRFDVVCTLGLLNHVDLFRFLNLYKVKQNYLKLWWIHIISATFLVNFGHCQAIMSAQIFTKVLHISRWDTVPNETISTLKTILLKEHYQTVLLLRRGCRILTNT